ncbi:MAG: hypothetical protein OIN66_16590 [Candidatus Methanoperedens sp.]|nr:hypothetical protein [Candidatus Methanoperedens sp.]
MNKRKKAIIIVLLIIGLILASGCLKRPVPEKAVQQIPTSVITIVPDKNETNGTSLSKVKVASVYESIIDGNPIGPNRNIEEVSKMLNDTHTDLVHRGFFRWNPVPESPENISPELITYFAERGNIAPEQIPPLVEKSGYNYEQLSKSIKTIKEKNPNIIFVGAIAAQRINRIERNDKSGKIYGAEDTWGMALDPQKWNIQLNGKPLTKEQFQEMFARSQQWIKPNEQYDWRKADAYFPDITNPEFQEILLSWAEKQVDSGADAIWIDGLPQTALFYRFTKDKKHPMINDLYSASEKIIDGIHNYRTEKKVYVGSWALPFGLVEGLPYLPPTVDFVTKTPTSNEVLNKELDKIKWVNEITYIKNIYNNAPIFVVMDWGGDNLPLFVFSQKLTNEERKNLLKNFDEELEKLGVNFVYPIHGGWMGEGVTILSFGKWKTYDSLAPEFDTYEIIKQLSLNKSINESR